MDLEFGDASTLDTGGTGWFLGFSDWARDGLSDLRYVPRDSAARSLCMKWMRHAKGDPRGSAKPPSEGRTLSILVSETGRFRLEFSETPDFPEGSTITRVLARHGEFAAWGEGVFHRWAVEDDCTIVTLRWVPHRIVEG